MRRRIAAAAVVVGCCALAGLPGGALSAVAPHAAGSARHAPARGAPAVPAARPGLGLRSAEIVLRHEGRKLAAVRADRVSVSPDLRYAVLSPSVEGEVYREGRVALHLRCDELVIDRETNDLIMRGQMEVTSAGGDRMAASEARWDAHAERLVFPDGLRLATRGGTVSARHASARADLQVLDLTDDVTVTFAIRGTHP